MATVSFFGDHTPGGASTGTGNAGGTASSGTTGISAGHGSSWRSNPELVAYARSLVRSKEPWMWDMHAAAERHFEAITPLMAPRDAARPLTWTALGFRLHSANLVSVFDFLTPILTVGKDALRGEAMPLVERDIAAFNHIPSPIATFDADAFDAALRLAVRAGNDALDLTPVTWEFDRLLRSRGLRDAGLDDRSSARRWNAWIKLADTAVPMFSTASCDP